MIRIAVVDGKVEADFAARRPGRGGYLHPTPECADRFVNSRVKEFRALRRNIDRSERLELDRVRFRRHRQELRPMAAARDAESVEALRAANYLAEVVQPFR